MGRGSIFIFNGNLIMVISVLFGEGKSFIVINLVISIVMEFDNIVMLVDVDVFCFLVFNMLGLLFV